MAREQMSKEETVAYLRGQIEALKKAESKAEALQVIREAGEKTGYKPVMRALVMAQPEETWVKW